jgi:hypothetical protein
MGLRRVHTVHAHADSCDACYQEQTILLAIDSPSLTAVSPHRFAFSHCSLSLSIRLLSLQSLLIDSPSLTAVSPHRFAFSQCSLSSSIRLLSVQALLIDSPSLTAASPHRFAFSHCSLSSSIRLLSLQSLLIDSPSLTAVSPPLVRYVTTDCGAADYVRGAHGYTNNSMQTVRAVLGAGKLAPSAVFTPPHPIPI